ncbi:MAG: oligosaccharide flippase family protein, partial [Clostridia bacterium]|nr:oligosaccharide flippase family protein [Clostridia bacterium]
MDTKSLTISNLIWRFLERCGAQGVTFIVSIVLARLLDPSVYGTIALVHVFMIILQVFVDSGLGNALIQKKNADDLDFSTVFFFNMTVCSILYILLFFLAPIIAGFYNNQGLTSVIRVVGLILIISGIKNIQQAYVSRNLLFKKFFFATLGGTLGAAVIGILM